MHRQRRSRAAALTRQNQETYRQAELEVRNAHLAVDHYVCPSCGKHVRTRYELRQHYLVHINPRR